MNVSVENTERLTAAVRKVEKKERARVRLLTPEGITRCINEIEDNLKRLMIPKKAWKGLRFIVCPTATRFPASYWGTPMATSATIVRRSRSWSVVAIHRGPCALYDITPCDCRALVAPVTKSLHMSKFWSQ